MWWVLNKIDRESRMATPATWHMRPNVVGIPTIEIRQKLFNQVGYRKGVEIINKKMINGKHGKEYVYSFELLPAFNKIYDEFEKRFTSVSQDCEPCSNSCLWRKFRLRGMERSDRQSSG